MLGKVSGPYAYSHLVPSSAYVSLFDFVAILYIQMDTQSRQVKITTVSMYSYGRPQSAAENVQKKPPSYQ